MEEIGEVKRIEGIFAIVSVARKSACDDCQQGCKITDGGAEIEALNQVNARVGNTVRVMMRPYTYLKGTILVYAFPALAMILGAIAGKELLSGYITNIDPDLLSAMAGFFALLVTLAIVKIVTVRAEKKVELKPIIEEILKE
ncbi:MAG: SoxR reducing system RseC family protein [Nitrospirota bacterium]|nr:MAG: SoxR reducing system RseC family protein [Nitrospirota bacterium]